MITILLSLLLITSVTSGLRKSRTLLSTLSEPPRKLNRDAIQLLEDIRSDLLTKYCPYNGLYGLYRDCTQTNGSTLPIIIGTGYDLVQGELRLPFFEMTYNKKLKDNGFLIPDQIFYTPLEVNTIITKRFTNFNDFIDSYLDTKTNIVSGMFSKQLSQQLVDSFSLGENNLYLTINLVLFHDLVMENYTIIPEVEQFLGSLPENYDNDAYMAIIKNWGTHIVTSGCGGGVAQQSVLVKSRFGSDDYHNQTVLYLLKKLYAQRYAHTNIDKTFQRYSRAGNIDIYGGDTNIINYNQWNDRVNSMLTNPALINIDIVPITDFIQNPVIRSNMQQTIENYLHTRTSIHDNSSKNRFYGRTANIQSELNDYVNRLKIID